MVSLALTEVASAVLVRPTVAQLTVMILAPVESGLATLEAEMDAPLLYGPQLVVVVGAVTWTVKSAPAARVVEASPRLWLPARPVSTKALGVPVPRSMLHVTLGLPTLPMPGRV